MTIHHAHRGRVTATGAFYFGPRSDEPLGDAISRALDEALVAHTKAVYEAGRGSGQGDVASKRIGAGYIGLECGRQLAYRYHRAEKQERDSVVAAGELQRHAEAGHWTEARTAEWLRLAGFTLHTHVVDDPDRQIGWKAAWDRETGQARMAGEVDGVITAVPPTIALPVPCIWESKKATHKKATKFAKDGVAIADPKYYGQLQTNMAHLEIGHTLFSMLDLDNMKYLWELVPFDPAYAQGLIDRAVQVMQSEAPEEMPRITRDPCDNRCRFCPYHHLCWAKPMTVSQALPAPSWLMGGVE